jgi:RNA polymerase sigma-70 factor (ECF subfamily)
MDSVDDMRTFCAGRAADEAAPRQRIIELFSRYRSALVNHVKRILGSSEDAEDVVQETCVRLMRTRDFWRGEPQLRGFLFKIATNLARDELRRRRNCSVNTHLPYDTLDLAGEDLQPDELVDRHRTLQAIALALSTLPPRYREVFRLHVDNDLSYRAISERLGISTKTVERDMIGAREYCLDRLAFTGGRSEWSLASGTAKAVA